MLLRIFTGKNQFWFVGTSKSNSLQEVLKLKQIFQKKKKKKRNSYWQNSVLYDGPFCTHHSICSFV